MKKRNIISLFIWIVAGMLHAQQIKQPAFSSEAWEINAKNHKFVEHKGKKALYLDQGKARLKNGNFKNGTIEYDVSFEQARNFVGVHFHIRDELNYEEYYLRPHQSGNPDAMQYTPVINGNAGWQLYSGDGYWSVFNHKFGEWMHVKLIIADEKMDVFIDDMQNPILHVKELKIESASGGIGFGTFLGAAYYANLEYEEMENPTLVTDTVYQTALEPGTIENWKVSKAFPATKFEGTPSLKQLGISPSENLTTDTKGVLNLSRISKVTDNTNAILAAFTIISDSDELRKLDFGYSDRVIVFVNGKPIYQGDNSFRSRDYRYLGSVGFFDSVFLDLKKGENEVVFAVSERMGGWGIIARLKDSKD